jgi:hypothetical protein
VEIEPRRLAQLQRGAEARGLGQVRTVLAAPDDPNLPEPVDLIIADIRGSLPIRGGNLTVLADGTSLTFLVNATEVVEIADASHTNGYVGVSVQSWNPNIEESFDNLVVRELE